MERPVSPPRGRPDHPRNAHRGVAERERSGCSPQAIAARPALGRLAWVQGVADGEETVMSTNTGFESMTATQMAAAVREREVSPVELVNACIERIERRNPSLNAVVYKGFDAVRRAREAEAAVTDGSEHLRQLSVRTQPQPVRHVQEHWRIIGRQWRRGRRRTLAGR